MSITWNIKRNYPNEKGYKFQVKSEKEKATCRITFLATKEQKEAIREYCKNEGLEVSEFIRSTIKEYFYKGKNKHQDNKFTLLVFNWILSDNNRKEYWKERFKGQSFDVFINDLKLYFMEDYFPHLDKEIGIYSNVLHEVFNTVNWNEVAEKFKKL